MDMRQNSKSEGKEFKERRKSKKKKLKKHRGLVWTENRGRKRGWRKTCSVTREEQKE